MSNPFFDQNPYFNSINDFFKGAKPNASFPVDTHETSSAFIIEAELPGYKKEDINLEANGSQMRIVAENRGRQKNKKKVEHTISVPFQIPLKQTKASYVNGILKVTIPKRKQRTINID